MEKNDLAMLKAENDRLVTDIEKLKQRLREEITRTQAGVRLDLNLEKGRMREQSSGQELKIKEVDTRIEQEIAALRTSIQSSKVCLSTPSHTRIPDKAVFRRLRCSTWSVSSPVAPRYLWRICGSVYEQVVGRVWALRVRCEARWEPGIEHAPEKAGGGANGETTTERSHTASSRRIWYVTSLLPRTASNIVWCRQYTSILLYPRMPWRL